MRLIDDSSFPATSEADWRARISAAGDASDMDAALLWSAEAGVVLDAVATSESQDTASRVGAGRGKEWRILSRGDDLDGEGVVLLDINSQCSPKHSLVQQCAIAGAMLRERGRALDETKHVRALVPVSHCVVLEVAKLMALRSLLMKTASASVGAGSSSERVNDKAGVDVELYAVAAGRCECPDQETHQIRLTYACLASVLGAADAILPMPFEESKESSRLATNVLLMLRHEAGLVAVQSIAKGSYYLEQAAAKLETSAGALLTLVDNSGGLQPALREGPLTPVETTESRQSRPGA